MHDLLSERLRAEFAAIEPIYLDGIAAFIPLGTNFATYYFRWVPSQKDGGSVCRVPALVTVRPRSSIQCAESCMSAKWISWPARTAVMQH